MYNWLPILASTVCGLLSGAYADAALFSPAADLLAMFAGFIAAAVVPTMILAATILRSARLSMSTLEGYRSALRHQISFFAGVMLIAGGLIICLAIGQVTRWTPAYVDVGNGQEILVSSSVVLNGALGFLAAMLFFRLFGFVSGVRSLFELHVSLVEQEVADRVRQDAERLFSDAPKRDSRSGFGQILTGKGNPP